MKVVEKPAEWVNSKFKRNLRNVLESHTLPASLCKHFYDVIVAQYRHSLGEKVIIEYRNTIYCILGFDDYHWNIYLIITRDEDDIIIVTIKDSDTEETLTLRESKEFSHDFKGFYININGIDIECSDATFDEELLHTDSIIRIKSNSIYACLRHQYMDKMNMITHYLFFHQDNIDAVIKLKMDNVRSAINKFLHKGYVNGKAYNSLKTKEKFRTHLDTPNEIVYDHISYSITCRELPPDKDDIIKRRICFYAFNALIGYIEIPHDPRFHSGKDPNYVGFYIYDTCNGINNDISYSKGYDIISLNHINPLYYIKGMEYYPIIILIDDFLQKMEDGEIILSKGE